MISYDCEYSVNCIATVFSYLNTVTFGRRRAARMMEEAYRDRP